MTVPEAAVDEYAGAVFRQDYIRGAGESSDAFAESVTAVPKLTPDDLLRAGVFRMDVGHTLVALLGCHMVRHLLLLDNSLTVAYCASYLTFLETNENLEE